MISSADKAPTCPWHRKPILPLITGLGQLFLSPVPTPHLAIFLASIRLAIRHTGHKYSLFSKPISLIAVKNITGLNFKNLRYFLEGKQIIVAIFICFLFVFLFVVIFIILYCFCALLCRRQRFNLPLYRLSPLIICLSRVWFCLLFFWLVGCLFLFLFFFSTLHFTFSTKWKTVLPTCLHRMSWQFSQLWDMEEVWALSWHCACVLPPEWLRKNLWVLQK